MKTIRKDVASPLPILLFLPVQELNRSARELSTRTPRSTGLILANDSGQARAEDPRIRRMLDMLEPMMLPRARAPFFFAAATTQVTSSGNDVPPARIVMAMNFSDRPEFRAIPTEFLQGVLDGCTVLADYTGIVSGHFVFILLKST